MRKPSGKLLWAFLLLPFVAGCATPTIEIVRKDELSGAETMALAETSKYYGRIDKERAAELFLRIQTDTIITRHLAPIRCNVTEYMHNGSGGYWVNRSDPSSFYKFLWRDVQKIRVWRMDFRLSTGEPHATEFPYAIGIEHYHYQSERDRNKTPRKLRTLYVGSSGSGIDTLREGVIPDLLCALLVLSGEMDEPNSHGHLPRVSTEERLMELRRLHESGLIPDEVYRKKQQSLVDEL